MRSKHCCNSIFFVFAFFFFLLTQGLRAQFIPDASTNYGFNLGLNVAFGSHIQRLGLNLNLYYYHDFIQGNTEIRIYRNFKNLGPRKQYDELVISQGVVFGYGEKKTGFNPFFQSVSNQTGYTNSFAYSYNAYFNKIKTTQQTGTLAFGFSNFYVISENDILARPMLDRFRTGAFLLMYQYANRYQFAINCSMWTGQMGKRINLSDSVDFGRCYMDTAGGKYTQNSHGLLSVQFKSYLNYGQSAQINIGADAEQVRNVVQNKIIHNMVFLPKSWRPTNNCTIPMLDQNGNQFLYKPTQHIKTPAVFWNLFLNPNLFY